MAVFLERKSNESRALLKKNPDRFGEYKKSIISLRKKTAVACLILRRFNGFDDMKRED